MRSSLFVVSLAVMITLSGCKASTKPRTLVAVSAEQEPRVRRAPYYGEYPPAIVVFAAVATVLRLQIAFISFL